MWCDHAALILQHNGILHNIQTSIALQIPQVANHLGVDNLNVVRYVGRVLDGLSIIRLFELVDDSDLLIFIRKLLSILGWDTVCISKVKGHADESLVRNGQVRALDRYGNSRADEAADFGRRRVWPDVADASETTTLTTTTSGQVRALDRYGNVRADDAADFGRRRVWPEVADARRNLSLEYVGGGILLFWFCIVSLLPLLVQSSTVMTLQVWPSPSCLVCRVPS